MATMKLRAATTEDADLVERALLGAVNWDPEAPRVTRGQLRRTPQLTGYLTDFSAPGDFGIVAETTSTASTSEEAEPAPVGVVWAKMCNPEAPGYGFVSRGAPEISLWVEPQWWRQGIATALIEALIVEARRRRVEGLSLSVDPHNPAMGIYFAHGFRMVGVNGTSETMLLPLR